MNVDGNGLEILLRGECLGLLARRSVGRVGLTRWALPVVYPVSFGLVGEEVIFAAGAGSPHLAAIRDDVIAFEADDVDETTRCGWSVLVVGIGNRVSRGSLPDGPLGQVDLRPWVASQAEYLIRLSTDHISGRRLVAPPAAKS